METLERRIMERYFRKTLAHPEGGVVHDGDCEFFSIQVCTCGLLHDLRPALASFVEEKYPRFFDEIELLEAIREQLMRSRKL